MKKTVKIVYSRVLGGTKIKWQTVEENPKSALRKNQLLDMLGNPNVVGKEVGPITMTKNGNKVQRPAYLVEVEKAVKLTEKEQKVFNQIKSGKQTAEEMDIKDMSLFAIRGVFATLYRKNVIVKNGNQVLVA